MRKSPNRRYKHRSNKEDSAHQWVCKSSSTSHGWWSVAVRSPAVVVVAASAAAVVLWWWADHLHTVDHAMVDLEHWDMVEERRRIFQPSWSKKRMDQSTEQQLIVLSRRLSNDWGFCLCSLISNVFLCPSLSLFYHLVYVEFLLLSSAHTLKVRRGDNAIRRKV